MPIQYAGEYSLDKCILLTSGGIRVDLKDTVVQVDLFDGIGWSSTLNWLDLIDWISSNKTHGSPHTSGPDGVEEQLLKQK